MRTSTPTVSATDGTPLFTYRWLPETPPRASVQLVHGMAEHAGRYARLARHLTGQGFAVYASDHRGHGKTAEATGVVGFFADKSGWSTVVADQLVVTRRAKSAHPGVPHFMLGHSMGSLIARDYIVEHGEELAGVVLTGTAPTQGLLGVAGLLIARAEGHLRGARTPSPLLDRLTFGSYNAAFKPNRTEFDWLSRDPAEVDAYVADPACGFVCSSGFYADLLTGLRRANDPKRIKRVPKDLPILIAGGAEDPTGRRGKGPRQATEQYEKAGVRDVTLQLYPQARHEILNEVNRDEVTAGIVDWLSRYL